MREHEANALYLARFLEGHRAAEKVFYPGLESHEDHLLAKTQMRGFGGMASIRLKGGAAAAKRFAQRLKLFTLGESLGGVESLVCHPASMTHRSLPAAERQKRGITGDIVRLSMGLENREDRRYSLENRLSTRSPNTCIAMSINT
jgi:cystathionine gamma-synthase/cystathionine gamma-lyase